MKPAKQITFLTFCERLGVKLTPAQRVLAAVSYDGIDPEQLVNRADREMARTLFGEHVNRIPAGCRAVAVNLCGARGGKSYVLTALRLLHLALTVPLEASSTFVGLGPGEDAYALLVAPNLKLARQTYKFVLGAARHPKISNRIIGKPGKESFILARENGRRVVVECLPATGGGAAVRARYYVGAGLEEFAFFRSEDFEVNDKEIFTAVTPRILPGGQVMVCSTAWARTGLMYELFQKNWSHPETCVTAMAPTVLLNPSKAADVEIERKRDPQNAAREFDCVFMDTDALGFFSHDAIERSIDKKLFLPAVHPPAGSEILVGADLGFRRDSSALVVVYKLVTGQYQIAEILELQPQLGEPLKPSFVVEQFAKACKRHECTWLMADSHYRETIDEELAKHSLSYVPGPEGAKGKEESHMQVKMLLNAGKLILPNHDKLIRQMKELTSRPTAGGGLSLQSPRRRAGDGGTGGHGDILSALVLAVSQRAGQKASESLASKPITLFEAIQKQTSLAWEKYEHRRMEALADQQEYENIGGGLGGAGDQWSSDRGPWG